MRKKSIDWYLKMAAALKTNVKIQARGWAACLRSYLSAWAL